MIYRKKVPPTDSSLSKTLLSNGWMRIKEPKNLFVAILLSIPFMVVNAAIPIFLIQPIKNWLIGLGRILDSGGLTFSIDLKSIAYIVAIFVFLVMHEMLHAVFVPNFIKSQNTSWGITPFGGFVSATEELSKLRFVFISVFPFVALSILMPIILNYINVFSGFVAFLAILNALSSSVDILNMLLILTQVPNGGRIINNGFETYYHRSV